MVTTPPNCATIENFPAWLDAHLFDLLPCATYVCAEDGTIVYFNDDAARLWGRSPQLNNSNDRFCGALSVWDANDLPLARQLTPMAMAINTHAALRDQHITIEQPDGSRRTLMVNVNPVQSDDKKLLGAIATLQDISDQKQREKNQQLLVCETERLRRLHDTILKTVPDLVYAFDLNHRFTFANHALLQMWGKSWEESIGKTCLELGYPAWHAAKHDREIEQVISTKESIRGDVPFLGTDGVRVYDYIFVPVLGADGEVEAIAGTTRDVTDRQKLEQELQTRVEAAALVDQQKDEFIAQLAHELRNPLVPIRNGLRIIELSGSTSAQYTHVLAMMNRQLAHMVRMVDDLLDVSRMGRNKLELRKSQIAVADIMGDAIEAVRPAIEAAGHQLRINKPDEPIYLDADLTRLAQVFSNLLLNSCHYTKPGGQIWFGATRADDTVIFTVRDNGIGIPQESLVTIFDLFAQVPHNLEHCTGGLGIGLALVKMLIELHDGNVTVTSDGPDQGSVFTVTLPAPRTIAAPNIPPRITNATVPACRILVVDDNRDANDSLKLLFELLGSEVRAAHDGIEALIIAEAFKPDLILMDIGMPNMNGYEATRYLRSQPWADNITIVAVTGWGQEGDRSQTKSAGCDAHRVKPLNLSDLEELLHMARAKVGCKTI